MILSNIRVEEFLRWKRKCETPRADPISLLNKVLEFFNAKDE